MFKAIEQAKADGGQVLFGARRLPEIGPQFVEPSIVRMPSQTEIVKQETFAPILYVLEYEDFADALKLQMASRKDYPARFSPGACKRPRVSISRGSDCGIANVNIGTSGAEIGGAFGGEKETGGAASPAPTHGKRTCAGKPIPSTRPELPFAQGTEFL